MQVANGTAQVTEMVFTPVKAAISIAITFSINNVTKLWNGLTCFIQQVSHVTTL